MCFIGCCFYIGFLLDSYEYRSVFKRYLMLYFGNQSLNGMKNSETNLIYISQSKYSPKYILICESRSCMMFAACLGVVCIGPVFSYYFYYYY